MKLNEKHIACDPKEIASKYKIGMFAQMNHVTVKALRYYEEQGLLIPAFVEEENGYRYYTMNQMADLHRILALKEAGFTIEDIKKLNTSVDESSFLMKKKNEIMCKIADLTVQLAKIEEYIAEGTSLVSAPVLVKKLPPVICATMQTRIDSYDCLFDVMPQMGMEMEELDCKCASPEYCFTHYLEPGYKENQILVETCEAVTEKKTDTDTIKFKEFPETLAACIFHKGSYTDFPKSYAAAIKYIEINGYEISGNIRENYIDGIWNKDSEEEWLSEIQIPVRKKSDVEE